MNGIFLFVGLLLVATIVFWLSKSQSSSPKSNTTQQGLELTCAKLRKSLQLCNTKFSKRILVTLPRTVSEEHAKLFTDLILMLPLCRYQYKMTSALKSKISMSEQQLIEESMNSVKSLAYIGYLYYEHLTRCIIANNMKPELISAINSSERRFTHTIFGFDKKYYGNDGKIIAKKLINLEGALTVEKYLFLIIEHILPIALLDFDKKQYGLLMNDIGDFLNAWLLEEQAESIERLKNWNKM